MKLSQEPDMYHTYMDILRKDMSFWGSVRLAFAETKMTLCDTIHGYICEYCGTPYFTVAGYKKCHPEERAWLKANRNRPIYGGKSSSGYTDVYVGGRHVGMGQRTSNGDLYITPDSPVTSTWDRGRR